MLSKLPTDDKTRSLVSVSDKMAFFLKINHSKSQLFIHSYYYSKFEPCGHIKVGGLSATSVEVQVWKLALAEDSLTYESCLQIIDAGSVRKMLLSPKLK